MDISRQQRRFAERADAKIFAAGFKKQPKRRDAEDQAEVKRKRRPLGPHFVPLFLDTMFNAGEISKQDLYSAQYYHLVEMLRRSGGKGFRLSPGTGSKRKKHRRGWNRSALGPTDMRLQGLQFAARHASKEVLNAPVS